MDIFGPTSLKICKLNIYRPGERIKLRKKKDGLLQSLTIAIELMINKARHEIRIVNTARWP